MRSEVECGKNKLQMFSMRLRGGAIDEYVIEEYQHKLSKEIPKYVFQERLKR